MTAIAEGRAAGRADIFIAIKLNSINRDRMDKKRPTGFLNQIEADPASRNPEFRGRGLSGCGNEF
jgi:hypothetical protein